VTQEFELTKGIFRKRIPACHKYIFDSFSMPLPNCEKLKESNELKEEAIKRI
jgi:hypothetical protein